MPGAGGHPSAVSLALSGLQRSTGFSEAQLCPTVLPQADQLLGLEGQRTERMVMEPPSTGFFGYCLHSVD